MKKNEKISEIEKNREIVRYIFFLFVGISVGLLLSILLNNSKSRISSGKDGKFDILYETYDVLNENYYKELKEEDLVNGAIKGMIDSIGDKHTMFFDKEEKESFEEELAGEYYGIGAEIKQINEEDTVIVRVFDDSPAEKFGLKVGDIFVSIDGESTKGLKVDEIAKNLKSKSKEKATIVVNRDNEDVTFEIEKDNVTLLSVASEKFDNIGYIAVSLFGENTYDQFMNKLNKLESEGIDSLIIDLRGNSGGYLSSVAKMISEFVDSNTVIFQIKSKNNVEEFYSVNDNKKDYKIVVLMDEESASASEIMASAMKEQYGATLVGKKTYGKGTVQEMKELSNKTLIKYTIQEWLTSKGNSINDVGIEPDIEVDLGEEYFNNPSIENDNQLQKAIELLK